MDSLITSVTEQIESVMKKKDINRTELAKLMGVSKSHISRLLSGDRNMRLSTVQKIVDTLGVPVNIYVDGIGGEPLQELDEELIYNDA